MLRVGKEELYSLGGHRKPQHTEMIDSFIALGSLQSGLKLMVLTQEMCEETTHMHMHTASTLAKLLHTFVTLGVSQTQTLNKIQSI